MMEEWRDVVGYESLYMVSNLGRVRSKDKTVIRGNIKQKRKGKILSPATSRGDGYMKVVLCDCKKRRTRTVHLLVAEAFLGHKSDRTIKKVVNHINFDRSDNRLKNLEIISQRQNGNKKHLESTSKYTGVSWSKHRNKWVAYIHKNGKSVNLGYFKDEYKAHLRYEKEVASL